MRSYYQTTALTVEQVAKYFESATKQDDRVLAIFGAHNKGAELGPSEVHHMGELAGCSWLLTSVRRSMATLTMAGQLEKMDRQQQGRYGRPEHVWRVSQLADSV